MDFKTTLRPKRRTSAEKDEKLDRSYSLVIDKRLVLGYNSVRL